MVDNPGDLVGPVGKGRQLRDDLPTVRRRRAAVHTVEHPVCGWVTSTLAMASRRCRVTAAWVRQHQ
ncbi:hypothetical protein ABE83_17605 [Streptomyces sp. CFMR 7]|nr:hypothetical protein ABE83_17605 [Streptomyces sp. CFMR 7]